MPPVSPGTRKTRLSPTCMTRSLTTGRRPGRLPVFRAAMRVLFLAPGHDDFLADGLFHGLRTLLGSDAVDLPRIDHLYADHPPERRRRLHGLGFTLAGLLGDDRAVDRDRAAFRAAQGEFDLVVFADIWRNFGAWTQWMPDLRAAGVRMAVLDTSDRVEPYPYA